MDIQTITTLIGSVGFPIVCCIAMAWYINNTVQKMTEAITNNTLVMQKILTKFDIDE